MKKGKLIKELEDLSYQHTFWKAGDIEILQCSDMESVKATDKDIVKLEDVESKIKKAKEDFPMKSILELRHNIKNMSDKEYIMRIVKLNSDMFEWAKKHFGDFDE